MAGCARPDLAARVLAGRLLEVERLRGGRRRQEPAAPLKLERGAAVGLRAVQVRVERTAEAIQVDTGRREVPDTHCAAGRSSTPSRSRAASWLGRAGSWRSSSTAPKTDADKHPPEASTSARSTTLSWSKRGRCARSCGFGAPPGRGGYAGDSCPSTCVCISTPASPPCRLVHTFVYDGDEQKDFIRGLGLTFAVPLREQVHNRHVRFGGEAPGLWSESVQPPIGRRALMLARARRLSRAVRRPARAQPRGVQARRARRCWPTGPSGTPTSWCRPTPTASQIQKRANAAERLDRRRRRDDAPRAWPSWATSAGVWPSA